MIDVCETDEGRRGLIPVAKHTARGILERDTDKITTDKNRRLVLYCGGGNRSSLSVWMLQENGFQKRVLAAWWLVGVEVTIAAYYYSAPSAQVKPHDSATRIRN